MKKNFIFFVLFFLLIVNCGSDSSEVSTNEVTETSIDTTLAPIVEEVTTTSTSTTTTVYECLGDNNQNINFDRLKNVQNFLNRYGFNAGEEDGYLGNQTIQAVRSFQAFAGLKPDGDIGPATREKMRSWTGCEERIDTYVETVDDSTSTASTTTTSTTSTTTTTTTIPTQNIDNNLDNNFGYLPAVSLTDLDIISVFKGVENSSSICGVPYINNFEIDAVNLYANGNLNYSSIQSGEFSLSKHNYTNNPKYIRSNKN